MARTRRALLPTSAELRILQALWQLREGTVEDVVNSFPENEQPNYKTTQAFLRIMEQKQLVQHRVRGRVFVFEPLVSKEEVDRQSVQFLLQQNFGGSASGLLINLLENDSFQSADLDAIEERIRLYRQAKAGSSTNQD